MTYVGDYFVRISVSFASGSAGVAPVNTEYTFKVVVDNPNPCVNLNCLKN